MQAAQRGQKQGATAQPDEDDPLADRYGDTELVQVGTSYVLVLLLLLPLLLLPPPPLPPLLLLPPLLPLLLCKTCGKLHSHSCWVCFPRSCLHLASSMSAGPPPPPPPRGRAGRRRPAGPPPRPALGKGGSGGEGM